VTRRFPDKASARQAVWDRLQAEGLARFPFPPHGRIPNFQGAKEAARRLFELEPWKSAKRIKVNPDAPQRHVREEALRRGMTVFVPTPRLRGGFKRLDPGKIPKSKLAQAASLSKSSQWAEDVPLEELPRLDAIVCGSVAVTREGHRWKPGRNVIGRTHLTAACDGVVQFSRKRGHYKRAVTFIHVKPQVGPDPHPPPQKIQPTGR